MIEVVATLVPWAGKEERLLSLFAAVATQAHAHESGCTRYLIYTYPFTSPKSSPNLAEDLETPSLRRKGTTIAIIERYNTRKALEEHQRSEPFKKLVKALSEEDLLAEKPGEIEESWVKKVGGFEE